MKLHLTFHVPPNTPSPLLEKLLAGTVIEADDYGIDPRHGWLTISKIRDGKVVVIGLWAPGVVRSCIDVGEFRAALVQNEDPLQRPEKVR